MAESDTKDKPRTAARAGNIAIFIGALIFLSRRRLDAQRLETRHLLRPERLGFIPPNENLEHRLTLTVDELDRAGATLEKRTVGCG